MSLRQNFIFFSVVMLALMVFVAIHRLSGNLVNDVVPVQPKKRLGMRGNKGISDVCSNETCLWEKEQRARKDVLLDMCSSFYSQANGFFPPLSYRITRRTSKRPAKTASKLSHLFVVDSLKLIYCSIPKVGCTSWKRLLLVLNGNFNSTRDMLLGQKQSHEIADLTFRSLSSYSVKEAKNLMATYHKFLFVRNPFERALSAYQDKFQNDYPSSKAFRRAWSERILRSAVGSSPGKLESLMRSQRRTDGTVNVTFSQFARFLSAIESPSNMNDHWTQMHHLCHPCAVQYDWIGHYDHLEKDVNFILAAIGANPDIKFPNSTNPTGSSNAETLRRYYSTLTTAEIESLHKHFLLDFSLFGFDLPASIRELLDERGRNDSKFSQ